MSSSTEDFPPARASSAPPPRAAARAIGHRPRMSHFLRVLMTLTAIAQIAPAFAVGHVAARLGMTHGWILGVTVFVVGTGLFVGRARAGAADHHRSAWLSWGVDVPYFVHWCASLGATLASALVLLVSPLVDLARAAPLHFPADGVAVAYGCALLLCGYGVVVRRRWFVTRRVEIAVEGLDAAFDGYRIVHLSDLHIGSLTPRSWGMRWVRRANELAADLAVVTGDMVTSGTEFHGDIADVLGELRAKDGVVVSMGNHDYFGDGEPLVSLLSARGVRVMRNEGDFLRRGDRNVYLAAIDDTWTRRADLDAALAGRPPATPTILLAHDPDSFRAAAKRGVDLVLSGHTHGGQIAVPFFAAHVNLSKLSHHYHLGIYRRGKSTLYVHPGLGTTG
ncbi:MAG TPA: metallophosphoesterase, partial [Polyangiaceae bacterium]|nr:metallophosphoesterase [Polyangiaceae bacterium]